MRVLILGVAGNLGSAWKNFLVKQTDVTVIGWDKTEIDVTDKSLLTKKIIELKPEVIINTVAYNQVDECENNKAAQQAARVLNINLVNYLGQIAIDLGVILIHYSSDYVFSGSKKSGYQEADQPKPINFYGQTKYEGEQELLKLSGKGLKWYLIRTSKLFGPKGSSPLTKPSFFELILNLAKNNKPIKAIDNEIGSFTYTIDLVLASWKLIKNNSPFGIYHLVNSGQASWYGAVQYFLVKCGLEVDIKKVLSQDFPRQAHRPKYSLLLNTKRPILRPWQEAIDDYIKNL